MLAVNCNKWIKGYSLCRYHAQGILTVVCKMAADPHEKIHTSSCRSRNLLTKMLSGGKKKRWYETPQSLPTGQSGFQKPTKKRNQEESTRVRTLNTILYKAVSDLLHSHEANIDIPNYNVEITKVSIPADFSSCRIYWKTSFSSERDAQIQQLLDKSAPRIRYLLISQQVLSSIPPIVFIRDKQYAALKEVERLLEIADYGPSEDVENLPFSGEDADRRKQENGEKKKRAVLFGIDHDALQRQIEEYKQKSKASSSHGSSSSTAGITQEQLDTLAEMRKQKLIEKKKKKLKKSKDDDDDITPKAFLLARQLQKMEEEEKKQNVSEELMEEDERKR